MNRIGSHFLQQTHSVAFGRAKKMPWQKKIIEAALASVAYNFPWRPNAIRNCV
jgi:hypothetical protein